jgi:hypothetical protein
MNAIYFKFKSESEKNFIQFNGDSLTLREFIEEASNKRKICTLFKRHPAVRAVYHPHQG